MTHLASRRVGRCPWRQLRLLLHDRRRRPEPVGHRRSRVSTEPPARPVTARLQLATTVGGTLGSLIGLAGYSGTGFGDLGQPVQTSAHGRHDLSDGRCGGAPATALGHIWHADAQLNGVADRVGQRSEQSGRGLQRHGDADLHRRRRRSPPDRHRTHDYPERRSAGHRLPAVSLLSQFFELSADTTQTGERRGRCRGRQRV